MSVFLIANTFRQNKWASEHFFVASEHITDNYLHIRVFDVPNGV